MVACYWRLYSAESLEASVEENVTNEELRKIHSMVSKVKQRVEVSREYMKWVEMQKMWQADGFEKGHAQGEIVGRIKMARKYGASEQEIIVDLMNECHLTEEEAREYCGRIQKI